MTSGSRFHMVVETIANHMVVETIANNRKALGKDSQQHLQVCPIETTFSPILLPHLHRPCQHRAGALYHLPPGRKLVVRHDPCITRSMAVLLPEGRKAGGGEKTHQPVCDQTGFLCTLVSCTPGSAPRPRRERLAPVVRTAVRDAALWADRN